jgi:hypothetical protein
MFVRTDRGPIDYLYLSGRLLRDLNEQDEAFRRLRRRKSFGFGLFGITANIDSQVPAQNGLRAIARRSADLVSDQTGTIEQPGYYVRAELEISHGVFTPHMGWQGGAVAVYRTTVPNAPEPMEVALVGSASNVVGYRQSSGAEGYYPSDMMGLYALLDAIREPQDPEIDVNFRTDDVAMAPAVRAVAAVHLATGAASEPLGRLDVLFRVLIDEDNVRLRTGQASHVLIGTPLWIATPEPAPLPSRMNL